MNKGLIVFLAVIILFGSLSILPAFERSSAFSAYVGPHSEKCGSVYLREGEKYHVYVQADKGFTCGGMAHCYISYNGKQLDKFADWWTGNDFTAPATGYYDVCLENRCDEGRNMEVRF
jgi:hypothetical protein